MCREHGGSPVVNEKPGADAPGRNQNQRVKLPGSALVVYRVSVIPLLLNKYGGEIISEQGEEGRRIKRKTKNVKRRE